MVAFANANHALGHRVYIVSALKLIYTVLHLLLLVGIPTTYSHSKCVANKCSNWGQLVLLIFVLRNLKLDRCCLIIYIIPTREICRQMFNRNHLCAGSKYRKIQIWASPSFLLDTEANKLIGFYSTTQNSFRLFI